MSTRRVAHKWKHEHGRWWRCSVCLVPAGCKVEGADTPPLDGYCIGMIFNWYESDKVRAKREQAKAKKARRAEAKRRQIKPWR